MEKELTRYALKSGYLEKVGHIRKTWKRRLFVLTSSEISYLDGDQVKGKIPLEKIVELVKNEVAGRANCLLIHTTEDFNKDYTVSFENDKSRDDWIDAILAAKENKPMPDSVNRAFVMKNEDDMTEDSKVYFNRLLSAFNSNYLDDSFQDVLLRLSSFFHRVSFTGLINPTELVESCDQVHNMASRIHQDLRRKNRMTMDIELLFDDLNASLEYCKTDALAKQATVTPLASTTFSMTSNEEIPVPEEESASRGHVKRGFHQQYVVKEQLGSGAYSIVYACVDKMTGERHAVKCIRKNALKANDIEALKNEVLIMGRLNHKNIVRLEGFYEDNEQYYIVTELVGGGELFDKIVEKKFYNEQEARAVVHTLIETVGYCHKQNIAHRDLKPENILVDSKTGDIKIADFGFAKSTSSTDTGRLETDCGSPWYVAPEILKGNMYGCEVDMWSLGVIMYILLCGYPPFHDSNQPRLFKKIRSGSYRFDSPYWDNVSSQAKDLIKHLLVVDPTQRYDARQALAHEWFRVEVPTGNNRGLGSVIHELRTFNNQRKGIIKQGYLSKQGHIIRNWKKRSFVLMRDELRYYKSETEKKPQGKIEIGTIVTIEDDPDDENGFIIKTNTGKDYKINAVSLKEKKDWITQINSVKRCFLMRQRAHYHISHKNYRAALELIWEARNDKNMMTDPSLLQLWGKIAECCEVQCGAMYMVDSVLEMTADNVSVLACCNIPSTNNLRLVSGDFQGNVVVYDHEYNIVLQTKPHKTMVTAISPVSKLAPVSYVATGAGEGSICLLNVDTNTVVFTAKEFKRTIGAINTYINQELGVKKLIAADCEGRVVIWDIATKKKLVESETDCSNPTLIYFTEDGSKIVMVCENGAVLVYDDMMQQIDFFHVGCNVQYVRVLDATHVMVATESKELVTFELESHSSMNTIAITSTEPIRCFDITADGKYAVVVSNEIQFWNLASAQCEANLNPVIAVRCMCLTSDFVSFFMSQDSHIEKWVIDWKIAFEGKKYYPPLSQVVMHDTGIEKQGEEEEEMKKQQQQQQQQQHAGSSPVCNSAIETVIEEEEEEEDD